MEESFRVRVDKVFGSLASSSSPSTSLWSITDEEIEKREWNRNKDTPDDELPPYPSNFDGFFADQRRISGDVSGDVPKVKEDIIEELADEIDGERSSSIQPAKPDDYDDEKWRIRASVGLDSTLDFEEEEEEYDKEAACREKAGEGLFMKDITDYGACSSSYKELPNSFVDVTRDPRANHTAAKARLKEDAKTAGSFNTHVNVSEKVANLKSILKRKDNQMDSKSEKRVRFDPKCEDHSDEKSEGPTSSMEECVTQEPFRVPDYILNPTKYTHYTFDSSTEIDEESNRQAYMDLMNMLRKSNNVEPQPDYDLPKSVTFTPKKKMGDSTMVKNSEKGHENVVEGSLNNKALPIGIGIGIAAAEIIESEVCAMEEDEPLVVADTRNSSHRPGRRYRQKDSLNESAP